MASRAGIVVRRRGPWRTPAKSVDAAGHCDGHRGHRRLLRCTATLNTPDAGRPFKPSTQAGKLRHACPRPSASLRHESPWRLCAAHAQGLTGSIKGTVSATAGNGRERTTKTGRQRKDPRTTATSLEVDLVFHFTKSALLSRLLRKSAQATKPAVTVVAVAVPFQFDRSIAVSRERCLCDREMCFGMRCGG